MRNRNYLTRIYKSSVFLFFLSFMIWGGRVQAQDQLRVFGNWMVHKNAENSLYDHLSSRALEMLEERNEKVGQIATLAGWQRRQEWVRKALMDIVGPFPEKTPLNAKVVKTIQKKNVKLEHIIFESQPGVYVTSTVFIPTTVKRRARLPVVIYCSGHTPVGYRSSVYQHKILNLVQKGFMVFAFDPVSQGERLQYFDQATGESTVGGPTREHSFAGAQAFVTGNSLAKYMIWDGIRAIDYLVTRNDVDPARIGITGRSGGGTQSSYIAAFDDRVHASAPECYITNFTRIFESIGPQDAEQNLPSAIARGIDHADLLAARAPKPTLMITTTNDFFSIQGARETAAEIRKMYKAFGEEGNFSMVEDIEGHATTKKNREAMYAFFQKHLNNPGSPEDVTTDTLSADDLRVTATGQVMTSLGGETTFDMFNAEAKKLIERLYKQRLDDPEYLSKIQGKTRLSAPAIKSPVLTGKIRRDGYTIEKYHAKGQGEYRIPFLLFVPDQPGNKSMIYVHPEGKQEDSQEGGAVEWLVNQGITVLVPDMIGTGETGPGGFKGDSFIGDLSYNIWFASILINESLVETRARDVIGLASFLRSRSQGQEIIALAKGNMAPVLVYATLNDENIKNLALIDGYLSMQSVVMNRIYETKYVYNSKAGVLQHYDYPDLLAGLAPVNLLIATKNNSTDNYYSQGNWNKDMDYLKKIYLQKDSPDKINIIDCGGDCDSIKLLSNWMGIQAF